MAEEIPELAAPHWHVNYGSCGCLPDNDSPCFATHEEAISHALELLDDVYEGLPDDWSEARADRWLEKRGSDLREGDFTELDTHEHDIYHVEIVECVEADCEAEEV